MSTIIVNYSANYNLCKLELMSSACTPILVGMVSPVLDILLPSKMAKFPFWGMDYSPWSSKNLINRNRLKKIMQVGVDIKCMHTSFDGCGLSGFGDIATFQKRPNFPFRAWTIVLGHRKIKSIGIGSKNSCR